MEYTGLSHPAVITLDRLLPELAQARAGGKTIVFTNGCYDILHPGHVDLLRRAAAEGDILVLGLNSDSSVRRQNKGADRPINTFAVRAFVLAHLASVRYVVEFDEDTPGRLIAAIEPDVLIKGGDWPARSIVGRETVEARGGRVLSLPLLEGYSTTALVEKIRSTSPAEVAGKRGA